MIQSTLHFVLQLWRDTCMYFSIHAEIYKEYVAKIAIYNEDLTVS